VFRELGLQPVGIIDYLLGAAQGIAGWLALSRAQNAGETSTVLEIFGKALSVGALAGVVSLFLMSTIYARLGARTGRTASRSQVFHVLAYGAVPLAASLVTWLFAALLTGEPTFEEVPKPDVEAFVVLLLRTQFLAYLALTFWSVVIQVMGLSEVLGMTTRKAFGVWLLGQLIGFLALLFLMILLATLFPSAITS
jgi:hypothetical protein